MTSRLLIKSLAVFIATGVSLLILTGCGTVSTPSPTPIQRAIVEAIHYDLEMAGYSKNSLYGSVDPEDARIFYAGLLTELPLDRTPSAFSQAYLAHAQAWKENDEEGIVSTWEQVARAAAIHGVDIELVEATLTE